MSLAVVILAAGKGTRMNSGFPKVLHLILKKPIINYALDTATKLNPEKIVSVLGYQSDLIKKTTSLYNTDIQIQREQLGTGHAVLCAKDSLGNFKGQIVVLSGDVPAITIDTLQKFIDYHAKNKFNVSFVSTIISDPTGYGRIIRDENNDVISIVEEKDANKKQKDIKEINCGIYCFDSGYLWNNIKKLDTNNNQNEYYLPGLIELAVMSGNKVGIFKVEEQNEVLGVNTREELLNMEKYMNSKAISKYMDEGVTFIDPDTTFISPDVIIGKDTVIYPNTYLYGKTVIGENCTIGPSAYIENSRVGDFVTVKFSSYLIDCVVENNVTMGPFCHLRPETYIKEKAKIGNFVEIKKSEIGIGSKVPHLSYVGDATVGNDVNIGAGTITCNYDGVNKNKTIIEDNVFIGSDTMLVAPVKIGKEATTAAGSTITKDVASGALAIERSTQKEIKDWSERRKAKKGKK
ncbi:MAG: bifunctional UDP-N-acetylglucosamine diphosphorylase/glucosamine-1-phosphate N-acetyltransferase GlmU [Candidatus Dadabacteria bacterium]|nr:bifunctional UDP-N-acetylglucosamine diphosphorylase/glucosamine-1-phosphate N-acetyltransferase GlmU [Candidatus Dadabacteria bacterium]